jgi:hypothetical protein
MSFPGGMSLFAYEGGANTGIAGEPPGIALAAGPVGILTPSIPIAIFRWGVIFTTAPVNSATALKLTLDWHPTAGSAASAVVGLTTVTSAATQWNASNQGAFATDLAGGSITTPINTTLAIGSGFYHLIQPQTKMPPNDASTNPVPSPDTAFVPGGGQQSLGLTVYPGQEVQITVATAAGTTAGVGITFIHYLHLAFEGAGAAYGAINNAALATGIPSSIRPIVGDPGIWTRAIS